MGAPKGNECWTARSSHGRKPKFDDPQVLLKVCEEYFQWVEDNPLYEMKVFAYQGEIVKTQIPKMRAMSVAGLCGFLDISRVTWDTYRKSNDFLNIINDVEERIRQQKFEGASADLLNANIIARDLHLVERTEQQHNLTGRVQTYLPDNGKSEPDEGD